MRSASSIPAAPCSAGNLARASSSEGVYAPRVTGAPRLHRYTFDEYLALEASSAVRHEFLAGEIYGMAGGTPQHAALAVTVSAALLAQTRGGPCRVHSSDLRVRSLATGLTTYPDVTVVCGPYETDSRDKNTVVNPRVLVEITSDSTEEYDRGEKLDSYQRIPSLDAVVLVSHREQLLEVFERQPDGTWRRSEARTGANLRIEALHATLSVDELYAAAPV
jgi:Uma2 family endonuclease